METTLPFTRPSLDEETIQAVTEVLCSGWITSGPQVLAFENALSAYLGGKPDGAGVEFRYQCTRTGTFPL